MGGDLRRHEHREEEAIVRSVCSAGIGRLLFQPGDAKVGASSAGCPRADDLAANDLTHEYYGEWRV